MIFEAMTDYIRINKPIYYTEETAKFLSRILESIRYPIKTPEEGILYPAFEIMVQDILEHRDNWS